MRRSKFDSSATFQTQMDRSMHTDKSNYTVMCQKEEKDPSESQELPVNNEQHESE